MGLSRYSKVVSRVSRFHRSDRERTHKMKNVGREKKRGEKNTMIYLIYVKRPRSGGTGKRRKRKSRLG